MEDDTETTPSREQYRRYGKRKSGYSISTCHDNSSPKLSGSPDIHEMSDLDSYLLNSCKIEDDVPSDAEEILFFKFASLLNATLQGKIFAPYLILHFEQSCRDIYESVRYGSVERHTILGDSSINQRAQFLLDEAASWSFMWHLNGGPIEEIPKDLVLFPPTSHLKACQFANKDVMSHFCLRIVQWLEDLATKALDLQNKVNGAHSGTYFPGSGIWRNTQRHLRMSSGYSDTVAHLDFDAPTRENAVPLPDDSKLDESLLEDVWTLMRAGRLKESRELCRLGGQAWRAATLSPFGDMDHAPSVLALTKNGKDRTLQAIELESGIGSRWRLWRWTSYCASERIAEQEGAKYETAIFAVQSGNLKRVLPICRDWESACWAMAKSWLEVMVDMELAQSQPDWDKYSQSFGDNLNEGPSNRISSSQQKLGPKSWPLQVLNQQPRDVSAFIQKLHSGELVHETVTRGCKEQHRQIQMKIMHGTTQRLLDLLWSWISPQDENHTIFRPHEESLVHGDPQMIRFSAHLVLILRYLPIKGWGGQFYDTIVNTGDQILQAYIMFLFNKQYEELVGIYASQLAQHRCIDIFVLMMELRLSARMNNEICHFYHLLSTIVKYKLFKSMMEQLPFSPKGNLQGSCLEIFERVLSRSRDIKLSKYDGSSDVAEHHCLQSLEKAMVVQWLLLTPPCTVSDVQHVSCQLLLLALRHSNILFREFALVSMSRTLSIPPGAHILLSFLADPMTKYSGNLLRLNSTQSFNNVEEYNDWTNYYSCDILYRNWLKVDLKNAEISPLKLSMEEKQRTIRSAEEMLSSSLSFLQKWESSWLVPTKDEIFKTTESTFIELHAAFRLCLPDGECMTPDAAICANLASSLLFSVTKDVVQNRKLTVSVTVSTNDCYIIEVILICLAVQGDGIGRNKLNDGGILATIMEDGLKGELSRFQAGVFMDISRIQGWYSNADGELGVRATYIVKGLCRRCCIPELILRCMKVSVSLSEMGELPKCHDELIELLVGCQEMVSLHLFSQQQLQEFLVLEREYLIHEMEIKEQDRCRKLI